VHKVNEERGRVVPTIRFFGDNAKERIVKPDGRLSRFRCPNFQEYLLTGAAHTYGGEFFLVSVEQVGQAM
jgi:hypothetical protein